MAKIGIDFGTTVTKVAYIDAKGEARTIEFEGSVRIPTVLFYKKGSDTPQHIGQRAYNQYELAKRVPEICLWIAKDLKRNLSKHGRPTPSPNLKYVDVISHFFKYLKETVENKVFHGEEITDVCITYPANVKFDETRKQLLKEAAQNAGFKKIVLLKEPFAAAMGYINYLQSHENYSNKDESILVYDFGGGTLDVTYVEIKSDGLFCPFEPCGDNECGGEDIDRQIYNSWDRLLVKETGHHISPEEGILDIPFLRKDCRDNKEALSDYFKKGVKGTYELSNLVGDEFLEMNVTYDQWLSFINPTIDKSLIVVEEMASVVAKANKKIDNVVVIGGSSNIAQVSEALEKALGIKPTVVATKDVAVANGAALFIEHGVVPRKCFCMNCGHELSSKDKYCQHCTPKTAAEDEKRGWEDKYLIDGHVANIFYDQRCEELADM